MHTMGTEADTYDSLNAIIDLTPDLSTLTSVIISIYLYISYIISTAYYMTTNNNTFYILSPISYSLPAE